MKSMRHHPSLRLFVPFGIMIFLAGGAFAAEEEGSGVVVVKAAAIHTGDGKVVSDGIIVIEDGKIRAIGKGIPVPIGAQEINSEAGVVTPGLIDAASNAGVVNTYSWTEHSSEVVPQMRTLDAVDTRSRTFDRLVQKGVTTVYVTPGSGSVIGSRGAVLKTAGPMADRVLVSEGSVKATLGRETQMRGSYNRRPYGEVNFLARRPTTRMGSTWVFRDAFYSAMSYAAGRKKTGSEAFFADPALETLTGVLKGKIPFRIQARKYHDIWSAIRLCNEFGIDFVLEEATEAYRCIPELKERGVPVVFGPIYTHARGFRANTGETNRPCLNTAGLLCKAGVTMALTAGDSTGEGALPHQAGYAIRGGLPFDAALKAVTSVPADILGLGDRLGTLKPGMDADLVIWSGKPFAVTSQAVVVMVNGEVVHLLGVDSSELADKKENR